MIGKKTTIFTCLKKTAREMTMHTTLRCIRSTVFTVHAQFCVLCAELYVSALQLRHHGIPSRPSVASRSPVCMQTMHGRHALLNCAECSEERVFLCPSGHEDPPFHKTTLIMPCATCIELTPLCARRL